MKDKKVVTRIAEILNSMTAAYPDFVESGIHGTAQSGVFYMIFRCQVTDHYLCFQWQISKRTMRFSQVLSNMHLDEAKEYAAGLFRVLERIHQTHRNK